MQKDKTHTQRYTTDFLKKTEKLKMCLIKWRCLNELSSIAKIFHIKKFFLGLPWWCSGWESACQCRGHGFEPRSGRIPHAVEQLGPCATTAEAALWSPRATTTGACAPQQEKPPQWEARAPQRRVAPARCPLAVEKTQCSQK